MVRKMKHLFSGVLVRLLSPKTINKGFLLTLLAAFLFVPCQAQEMVTYRISARNMSVKALGSYPQKLLNLKKDGDTYTAELTTFATHQDTVKRKIILQDIYTPDYAYPDSIAAYLEPTSLVDCTLPQIKTIADTLFRDTDTLTLQVIARGLKFVSKHIAYDNDLAQELDNGNCRTLDVGTILERGKGTCSEYTNLFLALMRKVGIPCRMVVGYIYMPLQKFEGAHAWAECYVKGYGWFAVDPQNGFYWYPAFAIKMFYGKDFSDCHIGTLPDMYPVKVEILDRGEA